VARSLLQKSDIANPYSLMAEYVKACYQCSSRLKYSGSNPGVGTDFFFNSAVTHLLFNYIFQKLPMLHWQG
jgi:hypothetical protein